MREYGFLLVQFLCTHRTPEACAGGSICSGTGEKCRCGIRLARAQAPRLPQATHPAATFSTDSALYM